VLQHEALALVQSHLVGGFNPSEKYLSVEMIIPNIWRNKKCSKPPTSHFLAVCHVAKATCKTKMACSVLDDLNARWSASFLGHRFDLLTYWLPYPSVYNQLKSSFEDN